MEKQKNQQYKMRFLDDEDHQRLKELAKKDHLPMNWLINQAIKKFLKEVGKDEIRSNLQESAKA